MGQIEDTSYVTDLNLNTSIITVNIGLDTPIERLLVWIKKTQAYKKIDFNHKTQIA